MRQHLGQMNDQVENLFDVNNMIGTCYAILNEGIRDATANNDKVRETLQEPAVAVKTRRRR